MSLCLVTSVRPVCYAVGVPGEEDGGIRLCSGCLHDGQLPCSKHKDGDFCGTGDSL